jgi:hypothetical protein
MGYKEDLKIDKYALDEEWLKQPTLFINWAEEFVEAQADRDRKKEQLDLIKAELDNAIRSGPEKFGLAKVTEGAIQNIILTEGTYRDAQDKYLTAIKQAKILDVAKEAFDHKKKALENLTSLFLAGYFANSEIVKGDVKDFLTESKSKRIDEGLNKNKRLIKK